MERTKTARNIEGEIVEIISEISSRSGVSFEIALDIILEAFFDCRSGKPEEECRQIIGEKIGQSKKEIANGSYS